MMLLEEDLLCRGDCNQGRQCQGFCRIPPQRVDWSAWLIVALILATGLFITSL
jgi:hypothetical protein